MILCCTKIEWLNFIHNFKEFLDNSRFMISIDAQLCRDHFFIINVKVKQNYAMTFNTYQTFINPL